MDRHDRAYLRLAIAMHERLQRHASRRAPVYLSQDSWDRAALLQRQIDFARRRGWTFAAKALLSELAVAVRRLECDLAVSLREIDRQLAPTELASVADIYRDLLALRSEFEAVEIDHDNGELVATTDAIELEGIELGAFEIRLKWSRLGRSGSAYRVVAIDPHPSLRSENVVHPHVQDESLCEGEGRSAIAEALASGRIYEFFLLVNQLLHTYGEGSGYVELRDWFGAPCSDCGESVDAEDRHFCHRCDRGLCESCSLCCDGCDRSFCSGCLQPCAACGHDFCSGCLDSCRSCQRQICEGCLEDGQCLSCRDKTEDEEPEDDSHEEQCAATCGPAESQAAAKAAGLA